jgi:arginyl-tRNA synthetase
MGLNPLEIAERVARMMAPLPEVEKVEVARPGFINFTLRRDWLAREVEVIRVADRHYGSVDLGRGRKVQLEFVSVNPTGPLHVGHGAGPSWVIPWPACWPPPATPFRGSTT